MPPLHLLLALAVVFVWGTNFVVVKLGLAVVPPLAFAALRFAASSLPWLAFVRRPSVPLRKLAAFGVLLGAGQFGLLFLAMRADISPGLASLVVQTQVFFTLVLSFVIHRERVPPRAVIGLGLAVVGIVVIASNVNATSTTRGLLMVLGAAFAWALSNLVVKSVGRVDALGFMVWSSLFALPPLVALSFLVDGADAVRAGLARSGLGVMSAVLWQAVGNTLFGYGTWNWLLARHPAATIVPLALLVPVFGMSASALLLGEPLETWKLLAAALVLGGIGVNLSAHVRFPRAPLPRREG